MKSIVKIVLLSAILLAAVTAANAQNARLQFENLKNLNDLAEDVVEVNLEGNVLKLAKNVLFKVDDEDAQKVAEAIKNLEAIYVRVYRFENENEYNPADLDSIRSQLQSPGWEKLVNVRSKKDNQKVDVYTMFSGDKMSGLAILVSENKSISFINVIGEIDIETLSELGGKLSIPEIAIETKKDEDKE